MDGNISFETTEGTVSDWHEGITIYKNNLSAKTFTLKAANKAKINSVTFHWTTSWVAVRWDATNMNKIATIGFFDGVHKGHRYLFKQLDRIAAERNLEPLIVTFEQHRTFSYKYHTFKIMFSMKFIFWYI